jgi:hypothetical protein
MSHTIRNMKMPSKKKIVTFGVGGVIVVLLAAVGFLSWKYQQLSKNSTNEAKETSSRVIDKVAQLFIVPAGEEPTVAVIQDKEKLGNKEFFKNAQNGDYLLIYQKEKVAIVFREKDNKLVTVGPISIDNQQQGETAGAQTEEETSEENP